MRHGLMRLAGTFVLLFISQLTFAELDNVLVIVNNDVITQSEFDSKLYEARKEMARSGRKIPKEQLTEQVMENMIMIKLQMNEARRRGITVSDEEVNLVIKDIVGKQGGTISQLRSFLSSQGISYSSYKQNIRESRMQSKLAQQFAARTVEIADYEIDSFLASHGIKANEKEYLLAHILLKSPEEVIEESEENEKADNEGEGQQAEVEQTEAEQTEAEQLEVEQVKEEQPQLTLEEKALRVQEALSDGMSFRQAVANFSDAADAEEGGVLGWKKSNQLPKVFADAVAAMEVGDVSNVLASENGLHILQLVNKRSVGKQNTIMQSKVRHILVTASDEMSKEQAVRKLEVIRERVIAGEDFAKLASAISDDSVSAANGGDLGWVSPGDTVPNFEKTFQRLKLEEVSQPIKTRYGVHLVQVLDRRQHDISDQMNRNRAEQVLRAEQSQVQFEQWVRQLRDKAYVQYVNYTPAL